jgi:hypothetical protein
MALLKPAQPLVLTTAVFTHGSKEISHDFVNYSKYEYIEAGVHANTIEGFWG